MTLLAPVVESSLLQCTARPPPHTRLTSCECERRDNTGDGGQRRQFRLARDDGDIKPVTDTLLYDIELVQLTRVSIINTLQNYIDIKIYQTISNTDKWTFSSTRLYILMNISWLVWKESISKYKCSYSKRLCRSRLALLLSFAERIINDRATCTTLDSFTLNSTNSFAHSTFAGICTIVCVRSTKSPHFILKNTVCIGMTRTRIENVKKYIYIRQHEIWRFFI